MSIILSNCFTVARDATNTSPSKQLFSFQRSKRFDSETEKSDSGFSYNIDRDICKKKPKNNLKTTFGVERPDPFYNKE